MKKHRITIVDDEPNIGLSLRLILEGAGYAVTICGSIAEFQSAAVGDKVYFAYDSSELAPDARATLDKQAAWLRQYGSVVSGSRVRRSSIVFASRSASSARPERAAPMPRA